MTVDNLDYYSDDDFAWTGVLEFYKSAPFENKKGTIFKIEIIIEENSPLESVDMSILSDLAKSWNWGEDRKVKAFKLLNHHIEKDSILLEYMTIRKSKKYDEIKFLLFDLGSFLNHYEKGIVSIRVEQLADEA